VGKEGACMCYVPVQERKRCRRGIFPLPCCRERKICKSERTGTLRKEGPMERENGIVLE